MSLNLGLLSVELPGIEPATKIALNCGNSRIDYPKRREMACGYANSVDGINTPTDPIECLRFPAAISFIADLACSDSPRVTGIEEAGSNGGVPGPTTPTRP